MNKKSIIIVEDCPNIQKIYKLSISRYLKNVDLHIFYTSQNALKSIKNFSPSIIITDLIRPNDKNLGIEFLKKIKENPNCEKTKIFVISGNLKNYFDEVVEYADIYFTKPFKLKSVIHSINYLLHYEKLNPEIDIEHIFAKNDNIELLMELILSINKKAYINYNIEDFILPHERNTIDICKKVNNEGDFQIFLGVLTCFFDRINTKELNITKAGIVGSLNQFQEFCNEKNISIKQDYLKELRNIKKLRNNYPTHMDENYKTLDILRKWGVKDFTNYQLIAQISLNILIDFLVDLDSKL